MPRLISHVCLNQGEKFLMPPLGEESKWIGAFEIFMIHDTWAQLLWQPVESWWEESLPSHPPLARDGRAYQERKTWMGTLIWPSAPKKRNDKYLEDRVGGWEKEEEPMSGSGGASTRSISKGLYRVRQVLHTHLTLWAFKPSKSTMGSVGGNVMYHHPWEHQCLPSPPSATHPVGMIGLLGPQYHYWSPAQEATDLHVCNSPTLRPHGSFLWWLLFLHQGSKGPLPWLGQTGIV